MPWHKGLGDREEGPADEPGRQEGPVPEGGADPEELKRIEEFLGLPAGVWGVIEGRRTKGALDLGEQNVEADRYDGRLYGELVDASRELQDVLASSPETFPALIRDLFCAFYKAQPNLAPEESVEPRHRRANRPVVQRLLDDGETYKVRLSTRLDPLSSGLAALRAGRRFLEELEQRPELKEFFDREPARDPGREPGEEEEAEDPEGIEEEGARPERDPERDPERVPERHLRRTVRAAAGAAEEEAEKTLRTLALWGLSPADLARAPLGERLELVRRLGGPDLARLLELVGRMRNLARSAGREKVKRRRDEVHSIALGADPGRMLPSEIASLASANPLRRLEFLRRYADGQVLSYDLYGEERKGRGPVVALIDASGSMGGPKMEWASALALALVDLAAGRRGLPKRRSGMLFFNTRVVQETHFAAGERDAKKLLEVATVAAAGGTDYEPALDRAIEIIAASEQEANVAGEADLLLVTDALFALPEASVERLLEEKRRKGFKLYSVLIGGAPGGGRELTRYCDEVWTLPEDVVVVRGRGADDVAGEVFKRM